MIHQQFHSPILPRAFALGSARQFAAHLRSSGARLGIQYSRHRTSSPKTETTTAVPYFAPTTVLGRPCSAPGGTRALLANFGLLSRRCSPISLLLPIFAKNRSANPPRPSSRTSRLPKHSRRLVRFLLSQPPDPSLHPDLPWMDQSSTLPEHTFRPPPIGRYRG